MKPTRYLSVEQLPFGIRSILSRVHYAKRDILLTGQYRSNLDVSCGNDGCREFAAFLSDATHGLGSASAPGGTLVRAASPDGLFRTGGWGGHRATPEDLAVHEIPPGGAIVLGSTGGGKPTHATVLVHPTNPLLGGDLTILSVARDAALEHRSPEEIDKLVHEARDAAGLAVGLTDDEKHVLYCYGCLKSGPYRREALEKVRNYKTVVAGLVGRGYLKQSANGATQITMAGKNTRTSAPGYDRW